jgi:hypothetical protein
MEKINYKLIILVLASDDSEHSLKCRDIWFKYKDVNPNIKVLFVYGKLFGKLINSDTNCEMIFNDVQELYHFNIEKTLKAFEYISLNYEFEYLVRTNLSTFWDFNILLGKINNLPKERCYSGHRWSIGPNSEHPDWFIGCNYNYPINYVSGTNIILSNDLIKIIVQNKKNIITEMVEDVAIGQFLNSQCNIPIINSELLFMENINNCDENLIINLINNSKINLIPNYRVKSFTNRDIVDIFIYKILLKNIYNIIY